MDLLEASLFGNLDRVRELLSVDTESRKVILNITDEYDRTPLHWASFKGHLEIVKELLFAEGGGIDPKIIDRDGQTPLHLASRNGHLEVVKVLLHGGADPNIADKDGETPLYVASESGHLEVVKVLLHTEGVKGADPNITDDYGRTPLFWASEEGHLEVVKELLHAGTYPYISTKKNFKSLTPQRDKTLYKFVKVHNNKPKTNM